MHNDFQLVEKWFDEFPLNWEITYINHSHEVSSHGVFHPYSSLLKSTQGNKAYGGKNPNRKCSLPPCEIWSRFQLWNTPLHSWSLPLCVTRRYTSQSKMTTQPEPLFWWLQNPCGTYHWFQSFFVPHPVTLNVVFYACVAVHFHFAMEYPSPYHWHNNSVLKS